MSGVPGSVWRGWSVHNLLRNALSLEGGLVKPADVHRAAEADRELQTHVLPRMVGERRATGGGTRLHHAAHKDILGRAKALLAAGAAPAARDTTGFTPMFASAMSAEGHGRVGALLARDAAAYPLPLLEELMDGCRPLAAAASRGHDDVVSALLSRGVDTEGRVDDGTALHKAARSGHSLCVQLLLAAGADVNASNESSSTPLMSASRAGHCGVITQLLAAGARCTHANKHDNQAIHVAAQVGKVGPLRLLLDAGASVNAPGHESETALMLAVTGGSIGSGSFAAVDLLLQRGADVNARDNLGRTPFWYACERGSLAVAKKLHARGADPRIEGLEDEGEEPVTPLEIADRAGNGKVLEWLRGLPA